MLGPDLDATALPKAPLVAAGVLSTIISVWQRRIGSISFAPPHSGRRLEMSISVVQRREKILAILNKTGRVSVESLARSLSTAKPTIRRDLRALGAAKRVRLVHGGALPPLDKDDSFFARQIRNAEEKRVIGRLAADLVKDGDTILIDSGSTSANIVPFLRDRHNVTMITYSTRLAHEVDASSLSIILIGGNYRPSRMDTVGPLAVAILGRVHGYTAFIGADGVDMRVGLTALEVESAAIDGIAARNAARTVLVADHTKFGRKSTFTVVDFDAISVVVTDILPPPEWLEFFSARGISLVVPPDSASAPQNVSRGGRRHKRPQTR